jgi:hypothetical protein
VGLDRGAHAGAPGADDEHVVRCFHQERTLHERNPQSARVKRSVFGR